MRAAAQRFACSGIAGALFLALAGSLCAQQLLRPSITGQPLRVLSEDLAVLLADVRRVDLPCSVQHLDPQLEFDLQYQAGYVAKIPLSALSGDGNALRVLFRIRPLDGTDREFYFTDRFVVPSIAEGAEGDASLPGYYTLGPGEYKVEWLMRDRGEQVCADSWVVKPSPTEEFAELALTRPSHTVAPHEEQLFLAEPPVRRAAESELLHVKILANFSPQDLSDARIRPSELRSLVSMLRAIAREPQFGEFSLVAFSMQEERILYEQESAPQIDFPALGQRIDELEAGRVRFDQLEDEESAPKFVSTLVAEHLNGQTPQADAIILVGPKVMLEKGLPGEILKLPGSQHLPIFHFVYNTNPRANPWKGALSKVLRSYKGLEYTITLPRDLGKAMTEMMFQLRASN